MPASTASAAAFFPVAVLVGLFAARYALQLVLRAVFQRTPLPSSSHAALEDHYQQQHVRHHHHKGASSSMIDPNEAVELAKAAKLPVDVVTAYFKSRSQVDRERGLVRRMLECTWSMLVFALCAALPEDQWRLRLAVYFHLALVHVWEDAQQAPGVEFGLVLGELVARAGVIAILPTQWSLALSLSHDTVDAAFEFTKLVSLTRFRRSARGLFVLYALASVGLKLGWFAGQKVAPLVLDHAGEALVYLDWVVLGNVMLFDLWGAAMIAGTLRDAFWTETSTVAATGGALATAGGEDAGGAGGARGRLDSDLSSLGGFSGYDSDSSISSNLKHS